MKITVTTMSYWEKDGKRFTLHSEKEDNKVARFWCTGHNPFPCFYMMSTYTVVNHWLQDNGYTKLPGGRDVTTTTYDNGNVDTMVRVFLAAGPAREIVHEAIEIDPDDCIYE